jgi:hypothetical protein
VAGADDGGAVSRRPSAANTTMTIHGTIQSRLLTEGRESAPI